MWFFKVFSAKEFCKISCFCQLGYEYRLIHSHTIVLYNAKRPSFGTKLAHRFLLYQTQVFLCSLTVYWMFLCKKSQQSEINSTISIYGSFSSTCTVRKRPYFFSTFRQIFFQHMLIFSCGTTVCWSVLLQKKLADRNILMIFWQFLGLSNFLEWNILCRLTLFLKTNSVGHKSIK